SSSLRRVLGDGTSGETEGEELDTGVWLVRVGMDMSCSVDRGGSMRGQGWDWRALGIRVWVGTLRLAISTRANWMIYMSRRRGRRMFIGKGIVLVVRVVMRRQRPMYMGMGMERTGVG
ncbi:MAG: hypothetical protein M1830_003236, partial [Pleopsidium flavum]